MALTSKPFLFAREKKLIALLYVVQRTASATDFQELLFLFCQRNQSKDQASLTSTYEFVPYLQGAFSFSSYHDRERLMQQGILLRSLHGWILSAKGEELAREYLNPDVLSFTDDYKNLRGEKLIVESYRKHPYYAIRSSIRDEILKNDRSVLLSIENTVPRVPKRRLFTIGYERRSLENYLNQLVLNNVTVLFDVRRNSISRRFGFAKRTLQDACDKMSITYRHIPELGIDAQQRRNLSSNRDYRVLFNAYKRFLLDYCDDHINEILDTVNQDKNVALTCYERNPEECHRHVLANVASDRGKHILHHQSSQKANCDFPTKVDVRHL